MVKFDGEFDFWMRDKVLKPIVLKYLKGIPLSEAEFQTFKRYLLSWIKVFAMGIPPSLYKSLEILTQDQLGECFDILLNYGVDPL
ncbi:MAG: hypothetical protein U9Q73_01830 [Nanoarchaeota archaeon]|nr:hypothetical protein [Nanoarchaeota archaeon]